MKRITRRNYKKFMEDNWLDENLDRLFEALIELPKVKVSADEDKLKIEVTLQEV